MSRAAGTLITTNHATYIDPRFMPGYRGHVPGQKFDFGETYGNETAKYFQDYRSAVLNSSSTPFNRGGSFPTFYSHNPEIVISNRSRGRDRYLDRVNYQMHNIDFDRTQELKRFDSLAQSHRQFYQDKTGTLYPVREFQGPLTNMAMLRQKFPY